MTNPRQLAFNTLREVHKGAYADFALDRILQKFKLPDHDRRLLTELVYGSVRRQLTLDTLIDQLAKKPSQSQPRDLRTILHLGLYQLRYQERIPASAAVNTTVELAKENGFAGLTGFVNGLLRQYIRLSDKAQDPLVLPENPVERLGVLHSFPAWIVQGWFAQLGLTETEQLCEWMNQTPTIDLRVNILRATVEQVESAFISAGILVSRVPHLPQALRLINPAGAIQNLPGFTQGWWTVQDASAQLVSHLLDPQPGEVVIDVCAAPGGKTTHIAELMGDQGVIWAGDRQSSRLKKLRENIQRLNLASIQTYIGDGRDLPQFQQIADRVLLDAPCSGLGTLHRHADARWRQTPESVQELVVLQKQLLFNTSSFVKKEGILVYATCTLYPLENEQLITEFLTAHPHWRVEFPPVNLSYPSCDQSFGWLKVWPHQQHMDGFFMVRLKKTNDSA
jgi:16S rRNA (cytosine967-C5)-methyltransferase